MQSHACTVSKCTVYTYVQVHVHVTQLIKSSEANQSRKYCTFTYMYTQEECFRFEHSTPHVQPVTLCRCSCDIHVHRLPSMCTCTCTDSMYIHTAYCDPLTMRTPHSSREGSCQWRYAWRPWFSSSRYQRQQSHRSCDLSANKHAKNVNTHAATTEESMQLENYVHVQVQGIQCMTS